MTNRFGRIWTALFAIALYGGPVLAGLSGHGWPVLPVFAALFLLFIVATRKPDLATGAGWAALAGYGVVQLGLVSAAWGIGRLGAQLAAVELPVWAPLALTGVAASLGAWVWRDAAKLDTMLDSAIRSIEEMDFADPAPEDTRWTDPGPATLAALETALEKLRALESPNLGQIDAIVQELEGAAGIHAFDLFHDTAGRDTPDNEPVVDWALLRFVASPAIQHQLIDRGDGGLAPGLMLNAPDARVRGEARARVIDLVDAKAPYAQLPDLDWLNELAAQFPDDDFTQLIALCHRPAEA